MVFIDYCQITMLSVLECRENASFLAFYFEFRDVQGEFVCFCCPVGNVKQMTYRLNFSSIEKRKNLSKFQVHRFYQIVQRRKRSADGRSS